MTTQTSSDNEKKKGKNQDSETMIGDLRKLTTLKTSKGKHTLKVKGYEDISSPYFKVVERWRKQYFSRLPVIIVSRYE